jgi:glycosyltransferase involved in cell wall biosynthesis
MIELSIVLISKNQAWNIPRLLASVLRATSCISSKEIILVDSCSTDETVELACRYPISVMHLRSGQRLSPSAGRYIGYQRTQGEFILFLDGDMELLHGWVGEAVRFMRGMPSAGLMLSNRMIELAPPGASTPPPPEKVHMSVPKEVSSVSFVVGGAALYRRSVLEHVGTFNPFLYSDEEPELYLRIRHAGYRILQLDFPIVRHFSSSQETILGLLGRRKRHFLLGVGQCIRYHLGDNLFWAYLKERGMWSLTATVGLAVVLGTLLLSLITRDKLWLSSLLFALCLLVAYAAIRKRSLRRGLISIFHRLLMVEGLFRGLLMKPLPPDIYPCNVEVVKECEDLSLVKVGS